MFNALVRIANEEGVKTLWKGAAPTVARGKLLIFKCLLKKFLNYSLIHLAMVVNGAQLASYSQSKEVLIETGYFHEGAYFFYSTTFKIK